MRPSRRDTRFVFLKLFLKLSWIKFPKMWDKVSTFQKNRSVKNDPNHLFAFLFLCRNSWRTWNVTRLLDYQKQTLRYLIRIKITCLTGLTLFLLGVSLTNHRWHYLGHPDIDHVALVKLNSEQYISSHDSLRSSVPILSPW